jgi:hypothetical protein
MSRVPFSLVIRPSNSGTLTFNRINSSLLAGFSATSWRFSAALSSITNIRDIYLWTITEGSTSSINSSTALKSDRSTLRIRGGSARDKPVPIAAKFNKTTMGKDLSIRIPRRLWGSLCLKGLELIIKEKSTRRARHQHYFVVVGHDGRRFMTDRRSLISWTFRGLDLKAIKHLAALTY